MIRAVPIKTRNSRRNFCLGALGVSSAAFVVTSLTTRSSTLKCPVARLYASGEMFHAPKIVEPQLKLDPELVSLMGAVKAFSSGANTNSAFRREDLHSLISFIKSYPSLGAEKVNSIESFNRYVSTEMPEKLMGYGILVIPRSGIYKTDEGLQAPLLLPSFYRIDSVDPARHRTRDGKIVGHITIKDENKDMELKLNALEGYPHGHPFLHYNGAVVAVKDTHDAILTSILGRSKHEPLVTEYEQGAAHVKQFAYPEYQSQTVVEDVNRFYSDASRTQMTNLDAATIALKILNARTGGRYKSLIASMMLEAVTEATSGVVRELPAYDAMFSRNWQNTRGFYELFHVHSDAWTLTKQLAQSDNIVGTLAVVLAGTGGDRSEEVFGTIDVGKLLADSVLALQEKLGIDIKETKNVDLVCAATLQLPYIMLDPTKRKPICELLIQKVRKKMEADVAEVIKYSKVSRPFLFPLITYASVAVTSGAMWFGSRVSEKRKAAMALKVLYPDRDEVVAAYKDLQIGVSDKKLNPTLRNSRIENILAIAEETCLGELAPRIHRSLQYLGSLDLCTNGHRQKLERMIKKFAPAGNGGHHE